jgi:hypothetical protein
MAFLKKADIIAVLIGDEVLQLLVFGHGAWGMGHQTRKLHVPHAF